MLSYIVSRNIFIVKKNLYISLDNFLFMVYTIYNQVIKAERIDRDRITLTSVNPYYPPRVFEHEQMNDVAVVGKVISSQRIY